MWSTKQIHLLAAILLLMLSAAATQVAAQEYDFGGYLKTLLIAGKTYFNEDYFLSLHRLRTQLTVNMGSYVECLAALDNQLRWGSYLDTLEYSYARPLDDRYYVDLSVNPVDNNTAHWRSEFYRLYIRASSRKANLTVGRQRIAWGTGRLWNPTDLFNPVSPLQLEPGEKRGADAVFLGLRPMENLHLEAAGAIGSDKNDTRWGLRGRSKLGSYDISAMAGRFRDSKVVGFDFSGYIGDDGFRGEFTHTWEGDDRHFWRGVLSYERGFKNGVIMLAEYLYNGGNIADFSLEAIESLATFDAITTINRHFLAIQITKDLTPLIYGSLLSLVEIEDGGVFLFPTVAYSWKQDIDIIVGAQLFFADEGDFSFAHNTILMAIEWYF